MKRLLLIISLLIGSYCRSMDNLTPEIIERAEREDLAIQLIEEILRLELMTPDSRLYRAGIIFKLNLLPLIFPKHGNSPLRKRSDGSYPCIKTIVVE